MGAVVSDVQTEALYQVGEKSSLLIRKNIAKFFFGYSKNFFLRMFYTYFARNFGFATIELTFGLAFLSYGIVLGASQWIHSSRLEQLSSAGSVMLAALPVIIGVQLLVGFISFDVNGVPRRPLHPSLIAIRKCRKMVGQDGA